MTDISKPVTRRTREAHPTKQRRIIATLGPGDTVSLRLERSSQVFHKDLHELYSQLELRTAAAHAGVSVAPCKNPKAVRNV
jgi:hypothetical protein